MCKVFLRPIEKYEDIEKIYMYVIRSDKQFLFSKQFACGSFGMFEKWLNEQIKFWYHDFFIICDEKQNTIGFTYSYEFNLNDAHCKYSLCIFEEYEGKGLGAAAGMKMLKYLFNTYPLKQVFISVYDYNQNSLQINRKAGFKEVGCLPNYRFHNGEYFDMHILVMTREKYRDSWFGKK